jgi:mannose-6-phosphate isomerase-like protein (cupin superfamily)
MNTAIINEARKFSLDGIQKNQLLSTDDLELVLLCFEAGQRDEERVHRTSSVYQVLEGEALIYQGGERERLGKGKLLSVPGGTAHVLENAGGGLLVILATRAR